jgi:hypothetical protein
MRRRRHRRSGERQSRAVAERDRVVPLLGGIEIDAGAGGSAKEQIVGEQVEAELGIPIRVLRAAQRGEIVAQHAARRRLAELDGRSGQHPDGLAYLAFAACATVGVPVQIGVESRRGHGLTPQPAIHGVPA